MIRILEILDNIEGDCAFSWDGAILHCTAWESEAEAQAASNWSRHYTQRTGIRKGGRKEALRILENLRNAIHDTYLRHILGLSTSGKFDIRFDADLYHVADTPPLRNRASVAASPEMPARTTGRVLLNFFLSSRMRIAAGCAILIALGTIGAFVLRSASRNASISPETQKLMAAELLPGLPLLGKKFSEIADENRSIVVAGAKLRTATPFASADIFFDTFRPLDHTEQLIVFHTSVGSNAGFPNQKKAVLLRNLYRKNLAYVLRMNGGQLINFAYDYLRNQGNKKNLIEYLIALAKENPHTALSREALLILANVIEIQQRLSELLFFTDVISETCNKTDSHTDEQAVLVCHNFKKYHHWRKMTKTELREKFNQLHEQILSLAATNIGDSYRLNDARFTLAATLMQRAETPEEWVRGYRHMNSIVPNSGDFLLRQPYLKLKKLFAEKPQLRIDTEAEAREERILREKEAEVDNLRTRLANRKTYLTQLKELIGIAWNEYYSKLMAELDDRAKTQINNTKPPTVPPK